MLKPSVRIIVINAVLLLTGWYSRSQADDDVDFQLDIAPVLQQRCLNCHNDRDRRGGLSLQSHRSLKSGGDSGEVVTPGDSDASYLLHLIQPADGNAEMPKNAAPLKPEQITAIRNWIQSGAKWPEDLVLEPPVLWSLRPIQRPAVPVNEDMIPGFPIQNPIDAFVAARLAAASLTSAPQAERRTLIRRLYLDLTGLPPSPAAVESFMASSEPMAYEELVEELLSSPHYGEHWGRHWLDLARYADSEGYLGDDERPHAWVYREWVINAINNDVPFDQFTIDQLAGDLFAEPTLEQKIATGFHRNTLRNTEAGVDLELYRTKEIVDRVNTTGMVWLGLTLGCAECHDHKNDPISQKEFYELYAFFNNADEVGIATTSPWETAEYDALLESWQPAWNQILQDLKRFEVETLTNEEKKEVARTLDKYSKTADLDNIKEFYRSQETGWKELLLRLEKHHKQKPAKPSTKARAFVERRKDRRETFIHVRGVYNRHGEKVSPGTPDILPALQSRSSAPDRLDFAKWLFHEANPLTARVAVNRIWQQLFGQGLVATPNDFGNQGTPPTHPLLLDWLANEYRELGWSQKKLIRLIVTSSAYRMSSASNSVMGQQNVGNLLLWRQNSYRVNAESVRDLHLAASGLLDRTIGRRGIRPPLPAFVTEVGRSVKWPVSEGTEQYRRGMYIFFKRTVPYPMLMTFDAPDSTTSCSRRERSNTPMQALTLLNDPVFFECAQALGREASETFPENTTKAIDMIFARCLGRSPSVPERNYLTCAYDDVLRFRASENDAVQANPGLDAMIAVARIVMNLDEFVTRD